MSKKVRPIPKGYHSVTPYLIIKDAAHAIEFYKKAFGAVELMPPMTDPSGKIRHVEMKIGDSPFMFADEFPEQFPDMLSPQSRGGSSVHLYVYVQDVDTVFNQAVNAGAKVLNPLKDQFYGDRSGGVVDPFGHVWHLATHIEDVPPEELEKRAAAARG